MSVDIGAAQQADVKKPEVSSISVAKSHDDAYADATTELSTFIFRFTLWEQNLNNNDTHFKIIGIGTCH